MTLNLYLNGVKITLDFIHRTGFVYSVSKLSRLLNITNYVIILLFNSPSKEDGADRRLEKIQERTRMDERYGFQRYKETKARTGWLINMKVVC